MDYGKTFFEYYAKWLGINFDLIKTESLLFNKTAERDKKLPGYSEIYDLYTFIQADKVIVSYGEKASDFIDEMQKYVYKDMPAKEMAALLEQVFKQKPQHSIKYILDSLPENKIPAVKLTKKDYSDYLTFFKTMNPECDDTEWVEEYFLEMCENGLCYAIKHNDKIISVTDAPDMPYMRNQIREIGISTLKEYRGQGYAKAACIACLEAMLRKNICPLWSTEAENIASQKLAQSIGFIHFADVLTVTIGCNKEKQI